MNTSQEKQVNDQGTVWNTEVTRSRKNLGEIIIQNLDMAGLHLFKSVF